MTIRYFTGIGSRRTPDDILKVMKDIGETLCDPEGVHKMTLRSGGADGADSAFEEGCDRKSGPKEIYLPWKGFNKNKSQLFKPPQEAFELAELTHPAWEMCSDGARRLHARNTQQVLGEKLNIASEFVICWTDSGESRGGTATAINLARGRGIPVYNLFKPEEYDKVTQLVWF